MKLPRLVIAATRSGTGKTTITTGLILALRNSGLTVQPYKCGPDYIDPGFHTLAAGRPCRNLDTVMMGTEGVGKTFRKNSEDADISVIEGVMGMFDGFSGSGVDDDFGSTAHVAKVLNAPVILCIDASASSRSAAALALGFQTFDPEAGLAGFILNNIAGVRHYDMVRIPMEAKTGLPVFGYLLKNRDFTLPERHLGLVPAWERESIPASTVKLAASIGETIDLKGIIRTAQAAPPLPAGPPGNNIFIQNKKKSKTSGFKIGYARDDAFHFYYQENLDILEALGAELVPFSPIKDGKLPDDIGGIYFGGGYPELFARQLAANGAMKSLIRDKADRGMPMYAECGGLMYLMEGLIDFDGKEYAMAGVFSGAVRMEKKLAALGYYKGEALNDSTVAEKGWEIWGHVFHWSTLNETSENREYAFRLIKPGTSPLLDGLQYKNVLAGYFHIHFAGDIRWAERFVRTCKEYTGE